MTQDIPALLVPVFPLAALEPAARDRRQDYPANEKDDLAALQALSFFGNGPLTSEAGD